MCHTFSLALVFLAVAVLSGFTLATLYTVCKLSPEYRVCVYSRIPLDSVHGAPLGFLVISANAPHEGPRGPLWGLIT